jgi:hypothetical protein
MNNEEVLTQSIVTREKGYFYFIDKLGRVCRKKAFGRPKKVSTE